MAGQVVVVIPEGVVQLVRDELQAGEAHDRDEGEEGRGPLVVRPVAHGHRGAHHHDEEQHNGHLGVREGEGNGHDLHHLVELNHGLLHLLEDTAEDGRGHVQQPAVYHLDDVGVYPHVDDVHTLLAFLRVLERVEVLRIEARHLYYGEVHVPVAERGQAHRMQQREHAHNFVAEDLNLCRRLLRHDGEGDQARCRLCHLRAHGADRGRTVPESAVALARPEYQDEGQRGIEEAEACGLRHHLRLADLQIYLLVPVKVLQHPGEQGRERGQLGRLWEDASLDPHDRSP
mmetsp:Transcript_41386/g.107120  ORF Transcript_41386/g.107120 Transcript_41386/m.107120 type:complete len:287 (-) Transcript_41386:152-1012(-)